ncbi:MULTISPECIES: flagellar biosynthesis protein FliQ [Sporomusa]|uniref:Flagellar biosynthetic protein FliQ n=2 Tax=Sporomusa TaxID=2375 RepID=A0ABM9W001_9FIRM|nr:flagellar biosynthesis protein FliQ [Sporomusa sphaeroides]OLS58171.1 flagellar biosynthetic protein FliQ [Sporomusa sphaeroides DSM 2875]CVK17642.1 Flagellar biosynthetic protein FliQ [Sporomusa sphaeroides DSM 2875]SCM80449.1 flagellar biosynthesis protein [uncultured Sporomusa sp.]HML31504.1 flagellar biosynthesis protein FliQ [Sporomusa sphaeroides]
MSGDMAIQLGRNALAMVMMVAAPMLVLGLLVGIMVSIFQATTQIQEQTLVFIPKIIAVFVAILVFGPWMLSIMVDYTREIFMNLPAMVR